MDEPKTNHTNQQLNHKFRQCERKSKYTCELCDYITFKKANYTRHINSNKHKNCFNSRVPKSPSVSHEVSQLRQCEICGGGFNSKSSYYRHKKSCSNLKDELEKVKEENEKLKDGMKDMEIKHLKTLLKEKSSTTNNTNCNNTYNINISNNAYLNDHCKDALNIENFVNGFKIQLKDLLYKSNNCLVENGLENAIQKAIMDLPANERPIHVTDHNRGNFYIKVKNKETKEDKWEINDSNGKDLSNFVSGMRTKAFCDTREEAYKNKDEIKAHDVYAPVGLSINDKPKSKNKKIIKHLAKNLPNIKDDIKELDV